MASYIATPKDLPDKLEGLKLKDVTPRLEKAWWKYPILLKLNMLLLCAFLGQTTTGSIGAC
jgi:hypothetical protein